MGRIRGFLLKNRVTTVFRREFWRKHRLLDPPPESTGTVKPLSRFISWTHCLKTKAKAIVSRNLDSRRGYIRVEQRPLLGKPIPVPKGHLAVYVGQKDGDFQRILVPVVYFNHPLFGDLLRESEKEYGYDHPGGITIPCPISDFQSVQTRIKTVHCTRKLLSWKKIR